jgi:hypothetical protein
VSGIIQPFALVEVAIKELIESKYEPAAGKVGGDPGFEPSTVDLFVEISLVFGATDPTTGEWTVDIDCYGRDYAATMQHALNLEAVLIGPRHVTETMRIDNVYQNEAPAERPWDDDGVFRIGATYVFTARRPSA